MIAPGDELCGHCGARMTMYEPPDPPVHVRVWIGQCDACGRIEGKGLESVAVIEAIARDNPEMKMEITKYGPNKPGD